MPKSKSGMTLVELMVTLVIIAGILTLGIATLRGYLPKQQLIATAQNLENSLQRAQTEATARSYWTCVKVQNPIEIWVDKNSNRNCGDAGDTPIGGTIPFKGRARIACVDPAGSTAVWFDTTGQARGAGGGAPTDYQIVFSTPDLGAGAKAREVEVTSGGLIQIVKPGEKGLAVTNPKWAALPPNTSGGCE